MKKMMMFLAFATTVWSVQAQIKIGGKNVNIYKAEKATKEVVKAVTLSDAEVMELCRKSVEWMDANNPIADESTEYGARLARLTENLTEANGIPLNLKCIT